MNAIRTTWAIVCTLAIGYQAQADEEKIPLDKLPAKVKEAVKAKFKKPGRMQQKQYAEQDENESGGALGTHGCHRTQRASLR